MSHYKDATSKVGSLDNADHKAGGGTTEIFDEFKFQSGSNAGGYKVLYLYVLPIDLPILCPSFAKFITIRLVKRGFKIKLINKT